MNPSKALGAYIVGLKKALNKYGAEQRGQYSWMAKTNEHYVFIAEIDHKEKENNSYDHLEGIFDKKVKPLSIELGDTSLTVGHGKELFDAVQELFLNKGFCRLLLVRGTKNAAKPGVIKATMDHDLWLVSSFEGGIDNGFEFRLERSASV